MTDQTPQDDSPAAVQPRPAGTPAPARRDRPWLLPAGLGFAAGVVACLVIGGIGIGVSSAVTASSAASAQKAKATATSKEFAAALYDCSISQDDDARVADGGYTLTINGEGEEDASGISIDDWDCLEAKLKTPQSVISHIGQTSSLDGRQTESWGKLTMEWTYHPDRGLDGVYTLKH